jgi:hypothetical protein
MIPGARRRGVLLVVCGLLLGSFLRAVAADAAGLVVAVRGEVTVTRADGQTVPLALQDAVFQHDTLKTGARGRVQVCFTDETILSLGRNTQIQITECAFNRSEGQGALSLNVNEGVFRIVGGAIMKIAPANFKADTPTATIGIRGSSFAAEVTAALTTVVLLGTTGAGITVENDAGYRIVYIPGTGLTVPLGEAPGAVQAMDGVAAALLGQTAVGGVGGPDATPAAPAPAVEETPGSTPADPRGAIPGYPTDTEARAALAAAAATTHQLPMWHGNAVGLDLTNGWALRSLAPEEVFVTVGISGTHLASVTAGGMILHAQGTGDSADTFPDGPVQAPPLPFTFMDGVISGNPAITVTNGIIQPPDAVADISNWGWWEMDLNDPNGAGPAHHTAGLWQATSLARTAADYVREAFLGRYFVGTYDGSAHCLRNGTERFDGTSHFSLDFHRYAFTGALDFSAAGGPAMGLAGTVNGDGIHGGVTTISGEEGVRSSSLRGFFYSAEARTLQGAFDAQAPVHRYIGIFDAAGTVRAAQPQRR